MNSSNITPSWEPHGKALMACWRGDQEARIGIEMTGAGTVMMPAAIYFRYEEELPGVEFYALQLCEGRILDVGAGAGAHCLWLQAAGMEVTGLDISPDAVTVMQERGVQQTACGSFLDFEDAGGYDTLLFMMNGIGVAGTLEGLGQFLAHAHTLVRPGGQILLDSADLRETGMELDAEAAYFGEIEYRLMFEDCIGEAYKWLYVDREELASIAREQGWATQIVYEAGEGSYLARLVKIADFSEEND